MPPSQHSYGIDFGTTNSTVAHVDNQNRLMQLPIDEEAENPQVMRSVIYVSSDKHLLFGQAAINAYLHSIATNKGSRKKTIFTGNYITVNDSTGKDKTIPEIIELDIKNSGRLLQSIKTILGSSVIQKLNLFGQEYQVEEVVGMYIQELKKRADRIVGKNIKSAVIGRPVQYAGGNNDLAIERMTKACRLAGFTDITFEYEPVGAAYDYGVSIQDTKKVAIFDFGGGTLDFSILQFPSKKVLVSTGIPIGGDVLNSEIFTSKLARYFGSELTYGEKQLHLPCHIFISLQNWYEISLMKNRQFFNSLEHFRYLCSDKKSLGRLKSLVDNSQGFSMYEEVDRVKKSLTAGDRAIYRLQAKDIHIEESLTKEEFETMIEGYIDNIKQFIGESLASNNLTRADIDIVATTGGSSLIPSVHQLLVEMFGRNKIKQSNIFTGVARGLALIAKRNQDLHT